MSSIAAQALAIGYPRRTLARDISFALNAGEAIAVLGPNGSGKTTLFRTLLGLLPVIHGTVNIGARAITAMAPADIARAVAYVPQAAGGAFDFSVVEMVEMARVAHLAWYALPGKHDRDCAMSALNVVGMAGFAARRYAELSGGERQLVLIARALATEAKTILLDEPTASLDFGNQLRVLDEIARLKAQGVAILFTTHHPEQALQLAERTLAIDRHGAACIGATRQMLTPAFVADLYGVSEAALARHAARPHFNPIGVLST